MKLETLKEMEYTLANLDTEIQEIILNNTDEISQYLDIDMDEAMKIALDSFFKAL